MTVRNLAGKYRPKKLEEVVGAENAVAALRPILKRKELPTCMLFTGPSGTGKTTLSRLVGRYLNCKTRDACGKCISCQAMENESHPDFMEMNTADMRGIDSMRDLVKGSKFKPQMGRARIIYLDECHQLTKDAAQLLLKHLEEPSEHTVFVLATTNPEKLLPTVLGRCTPRVVLRFIEPDIMIPHLHHIAKLEGYNFLRMGKGDKAEQKANGRKLLRTVAELSNGQMRDGLSILETLIATHQSGNYKTLESLAEAFQKRFDFAADQIAVKVLFNVYRGQIDKAIKALYDQEDVVRQVMHKMRWTNDKLLRNKIGAKVPWVDIAYKDLVELMRGKGLKVPLEVLLEVQRQLNTAESRMNSLNIPELLLMSDAVYEMCTVANRYLEKED